MAKKKSTRDGTLKPGAKGKPARHVPGPAAPPDVFDPTQMVEEQGLFWQNGKGDVFIVGNEHRGYAFYPKQAVIDLLRKRYLICTKKRDGEALTEAADVILYLREERRLEDVVPFIAGYPAGVHLLDDQKVLVRGAVKLPVPTQGEWPVIREFVESRLDLRRLSPDASVRDGSVLSPIFVNQCPWFWSWCRLALWTGLNSLPGGFAPGHCMVFAGAVNSGKGRLQNQIISGLLGGREGDPTKFLTGEDEFNADMFRAIHLMVEELPMPSQKMNARQFLAEQIKKMVTSNKMRMRLMRTDPVSVANLRRLTMSINDEADDLRSFPVVTGSFADKILFFKVASQGESPFPMPLGTPEQQQAFRDACAAEMPAFAWWLLNVWQIPDGSEKSSAPGLDLTKYGDGRPARFGFTEFAHPDLVGSLFDETPAAELMEIIDAARFSRGQLEEVRLWELPYEDGVNASTTETSWHGSALMLERLLRGQAGWNSNVCKQAESFFKHNGCGRSLGTLRSKQADSVDQRIDKDNTREWKGWRIARPAIGK